MKIYLSPRGNLNRRHNEKVCTSRQGIKCKGGKMDRRLLAFLAQYTNLLLKLLILQES